MAVREAGSHLKSVCRQLRVELVDREGFHDVGYHYGHFCDDRIDHDLDFVDEDLSVDLSDLGGWNSVGRLDLEN